MSPVERDEKARETNPIVLWSNLMQAGGKRMKLRSRLRMGDLERMWYLRHVPIRFIIHLMLQKIGVH